MTISTIYAPLVLRSRAACLAAALAFGAAIAPASAQDPNAVVAKVNGVEIRQGEIDIATEMLGGALAQMNAAAKRDNVIAYVIDMKLATKAATDKKLDKTDDFKRRLAFASEKLLMDQMLSDATKAAVTDAAMKTVYDEAAKQIASEVEVHARHILVETESEAKAIAAELKKGTDFAELAKKKSKDPGAADGGDLGYFTKDQMVKEFSEAAFKLEPGKISDPVKTQFGWHIIKVEDKRNRKPPAFDQVKDQIRAYVTRKAQADAIAKLRSEAKIERMDGNTTTEKKDDKPAPAQK